MARKVRKGDRVEFTGKYAPELKEESKYGPGTVVGFREYGEKATVHLENGLFADWPVTECRILT